MKNILYILLSTLFILALIEFVAKQINLFKGDEIPFLVFIQNNNNSIKGFGFDEVDLLTGWRASEKALNNSTFEIKYGMPYLTNRSFPCKECFKVIVTGGSTTDIFLNKDNWPVDLLTYFEKEMIPIEIYVAAIGGYNSGQEFLSLLELIDTVQPNLHISYSGANEEDAFYVTPYEEEIFHRMASPSFFMPNTVFLLSANIKLEPIKRHNPMLFWTRNMKLMKALADMNGYRFIGVLQPVLRGEKPDEAQLYNDYDYFMDHYNVYYASIVDTAKKYDFIYDMTQIFKDLPETPFVDDCHIKSKYQYIVAKNVFETIITIDSTLQNRTY